MTDQTTSRGSAQAAASRGARLQREQARKVADEELQPRIDQATTALRARIDELGAALDRERQAREQAMSAGMQRTVDSRPVVRAPVTANPMIERQHSTVRDPWAGDLTHDPEFMRLATTQGIAEANAWLARKAAERKAAEEQRRRDREVMYRSRKFCGRPVGLHICSPSWQCADCMTAEGTPVIEGDTPLRREQREWEAQRHGYQTVIRSQTPRVDPRTGLPGVPTPDDREPARRSEWENGAAEGTA